MVRVDWRQVREPAVALPGRDHANTVRVADHILDHARAGRVALERGRLIEAKYHRDNCSVLLWRLGVDGLTADGQLRFDAAKYETRLAGRLSSEAARAIRESPQLRGRAQRALMNALACDHIVPRNCVAEALISPTWIDLDDVGLARDFVITLSEVAIISPEENDTLDGAGWQSDMPVGWWAATANEKVEKRFLRYETVGITVTLPRHIG